MLKGNKDPSQIEMIKINKPDVVFLDINMPVLNEFDFLEEYDERKFMVVIVSIHEEFGISALKNRRRSRLSS